MTKGSWGKRLQSKRATTLVEFALSLPLLALMLFAIIQYGFIFAAYTTVRNATAVAARYATLSTSPLPTQAQVETLAKQALSPMLDPTKATATANMNTTVGGLPNAKSVKIDYSLKLIVPFVVPGKTSGSSITISATTIMR